MLIKLTRALPYSFFRFLRFILFPLLKTHVYVFLFFFGFFFRSLHSYGQSKGGNNLKTSGLITLDITVSNPSCGYNNGSILVVPSGGIAPYHYSLSGNQQSNGYFPGLNATYSYTVLVTDVAGNSTSMPVTLTNTLPPPVIIINATVLPTNCTSTDGVITLSGSGGVPPYRYSIDGVNFSSNNIFPNLTQGEYFFFIQDANGCVAKGGIGFIPGQFDCINPCGLHCNGEGGQNSVACGNDGSLDISASGGVPPYLYSIDGNNYFPGSSNPGFSNEFTGLSSGFYHLYVKDANNTVAVSAFQILQYCGVSYISIDAACSQNDGSITVTASKGLEPYSYTMDGIHYQTSNVFSGLGVGIYSFSVKDASGSIYSVQAAVYDRCPAVAVTTRADTCNQNKGTITTIGTKGTEPYSFSIDGINFQNDNIFFELGSGTYTVTIKDANGFTGTAIGAVQNNCIQLVLNTTNASCGNQNGSITVTASNGKAPYQYSTDGVNFQTGNVFSAIDTGIYIITVKDAAGLQVSALATVMETPAPQISVTVSQASCSNTNGSITITATGGSFPLQYSIDAGNSFKNNNVFNSLDSGQYITAVKDANGCLIKDTIQLTALPTPLVLLGNDTTICNGKPVLLQAPQLPGYQYLWQDNSYAANYTVNSNGKYYVKVINQFNCFASDTINIQYILLPAFFLGNDTTLCTGHILILNPAISATDYLWSTGANTNFLNVSAAGSYWLRLSTGGCSVSDTILIGDKPTPVINFGEDTALCEGQTLVLDATNPGASYKWQDGSAAPVFNVDAAGSYTVNVDLNGCQSSGHKLVTYISKPVINLGSDTALCNTVQVLLNAYYPQSSFEWQDGSVLSRFNVSKAGTYSVTVNNACGVMRDSINIVYEDCACKFYMPSAFTPNSDGVNDVFRPKYQCLFDAYELNIFNRWGQRVFVTRDAGKGWDGIMNGAPQPIATYVWQLTYKDNLTGRLIHKNGTFVLIR